MSSAHNILFSGAHPRPIGYSDRRVGVQTYSLVALASMIDSYQKPREVDKRIGSQPRETRHDSAWCSGEGFLGGPSRSCFRSSIA